MDPYRPAQRLRGRRYMIGFEIINTFSFSLLAGNIITLLLLRMEAGSFLIGLVSSFPYLAFFFMPFAKRLVPRWGLVGTFGKAWFGRYVAILPILAAPLIFPWAGATWSIPLVVGSYLFFQVVRGFGLVSISPLNNYLSMGRDQGDWLSLKSMVVSASSIGTGILVGLLLGPEAPLERYTLFMSTGILLGLAGSILIFKIPEPREGSNTASVPFLKDLKEGWKDLGFRRFLTAYAVLIFLTGLGRPFLIVFAKKVFHFGDDGALILTVIGTFGAIVMGSFSRLSMDRLGAKPLLVFWTLAFGLSLGVLTFLPVLAGASAWVILSLLFFLNTLGGVGIENASQSYFFQVVKPERQFNLGMVYYLVMGLMGSLGSLIAGILLEAFRGTGGEPQAFSLFFGVSTLLTVFGLLPLVRIAKLGSRRVGDALAMIFSPRDLRTMNLLRKLDQSDNALEEQELMKRLPTSNRDLAVEDSLRRLSSPLFSIRAQALLSLEKLPLTRESENALIRHVEDHPYASAFRAARILGERGCRRAIPALRTALSSGDYLLQAHAAGALGDLEDLESREDIERLLDSEEVLVVIHALKALKDFGDQRSLPVIIRCLGRPAIPPALRDEIIFALAGLLGLEGWLYPLYLHFLDNPERGLAHLEDGVEKANTPHRAQLTALLSLVAVPGRQFRTTAEELLAHQAQLLPSEDIPTQAWDFPRFRFFLAAFLVKTELDKPRP